MDDGAEGTARERAGEACIASTLCFQQVPQQQPRSRPIHINALFSVVAI
jgi:hypothetical protein